MKISNKVLFISILIIISLLHSTYLPNGFNWLDHGDIERGRTILPTSSWAILFISRFGQTGFYRPIVALLNNIDFISYGRVAMGYHLTNVLLHMAVVLMTPVFLSVFFKLTFEEQFLSMIIVGVAPIQWLPVGAIAYRPEILYTFFTMISIWWFYKGKNLTALFFFIMYALFSKETALYIIPVLLLIVELMKKHHIIPENNISKQKIPSIILRLSIIASGFVIYAVLRMIAVPQVWLVQYKPLNFSEAIGTRLVAVGKLTAQIFSPFLPSLSDSIHIYQINHIFALMSAIVILGSIYYIVRCGIQSAFARVLLLFWISLLPAFNILPVPRFSSSHYGYFAMTILPMFFILLKRHFVILSAVKNLYNSWILRSLCSLRMTPENVLITIWIIIASYSTFMGGFRFKNDYTLFQPAVKHDGNFLEGHQYMGDYYFYRNELKQASFHYERALKKDKNIISFVDTHSVLNNLAGVRMMQNRLNEADAILVSLQKLQGGKGNLSIRYNRALIAYKQKKYQKVVDLLYDSYKQWNRPEPVILLGDSLKKLGKEKEAQHVLKILQ